jgi:HPt (histidine-containing phosphotransfer) domain-containing protein
MDQRVPPIAGAGEIPNDGGIDLRAAIERLGGDAQLLREMAAIFVEDAPGLLDQVQSGRGGEPSEMASRAAHSLKGLVSNFSEPASNAAQAAESALNDGTEARIESALAVLRVYVERLTDVLRRSVLS